MSTFLSNPNDYEKVDNIVTKVDFSFNSTFPLSCHDIYYKIEDSSFWFAHRMNCIYEILKNYISLPSQIIDIGGGNGYSTKYLQDLGYNAILLEPAISGCKNARARGVNNIICNSLSDSDFLDNSIENACLLDVLEYIENDKAFLDILYKKLKKSGILVLSVPASKILWSNEDYDIGNLKRFEMMEIIELLTSANFKIRYSNYLFNFLFFPILFLRSLKDKLIKTKFLEYRQKTSVIAKEHDSLNSSMMHNTINIFCKEELYHIRHGHKLPFGSSIIIIAEKD